MVRPSCLRDVDITDAGCERVKQTDGRTDGCIVDLRLSKIKRGGEMASFRTDQILTGSERVVQLQQLMRAERCTSSLWLRATSPTAPTHIIIRLRLLPASCNQRRSWTSSWKPCSREKNLDPCGPSYKSFVQEISKYFVKFRFRNAHTDPPT